MSSCNTFMDQTTCENLDDNIECIWETDGNTQPQCIDAFDQNYSQPPVRKSAPPRVRPARAAARPSQYPDLNKDFDKATNVMYLSIPIHMVCLGFLFYIKEKMGVLLLFALIVMEFLKVSLFLYYKNRIPLYNTPEYDDIYADYDAYLSAIYFFTYCIWAGSILSTFFLIMDRAIERRRRRNSNARP